MTSKEAIMTPQTLLKQLINIDSVSGNECAIGEFLSNLLMPFFEVKKVQVTQNRFNVIAITGKPKIYLNTHLDTVPIGNSKISEDNSTIYGRGACDAKGSMSAMICAAIELRKQNKTNFGLFFNVGEETDFAGIKKGLPEKTPAFVVIGEPSELHPVIGQRGLLCLKIIARGKSAHGAYPEKGISAINKIVEVITNINKLEFPNDKVLGGTSINIGLIKGGSATNVVPDYAEISIEIRTVKENKTYLEQLKKELKECEISVIENYDPVIISENKLIEQFEQISGKKTQVKKGFTELYFWPKGIILGPGSVAFAHSDNEQIKKSELDGAVQLYKKLILKFTD